MNKIRLKYSKTGRAKYMSHLDFSATMQRALLRAGIELKYSEGFNPHPYLSVALPLSVGYGSVNELMDIGIVSNKLPDIKTISLPEGIEILDVYRAGRKFTEIKWIEVYGGLYYNKEISPNLLTELGEVYKKQSIVISKRSKRGIKELDIAPHIKDVRFAFSDDTITIKAKISAQEPMLNVNDLLSALDENLKPVHTDINRIDLYDKGMVQFS